VPASLAALLPVCYLLPLLFCHFCLTEGLPPAPVAMETSRREIRGYDSQIFGTRHIFANLFLRSLARSEQKRQQKQREFDFKSEKGEPEPGFREREIKMKTVSVSLSALHGKAMAVVLTTAAGKGILVCLGLPPQG
jgi:hypothetical protein